MELAYQQNEEIEPKKEVIEADEKFEDERISTDEKEEIESKEEKKHGEAEWTRSTYAGSVAIATGCVVASASGFPGIAVPCVVGGALYSGAVKLWNTAR